ncbi:MAG TPA: NADPH:quinone reductase [Candidatus Acidoferrales bacterium]|nr:NADPH:quinone reductase [Candidatus Acidoferrales bacterium]
MSRVKAIRVHEFGPPDVMRLEEVPDLDAGAGQIVVRVRAAGVNPVDAYVRAGSYARKPSLPYTPGTDAAGEVESVGENVTLKVGTRVYVSGSLSGAYAEKALCREADAHELPSTLTFPQGAAINVPYATAYRALFQRAHAAAGEFVLVHGASGGVGVAALQIARAAGLRVCGTAGSPKGMELVLHEGAHYALDHGAADHFERVLALTGGRGVDIVLEMLANMNLGKDLKILAPGGRVVVIGSRGPAEIDPRDTMIRDAAILGMLLFNTPERDLKSIHCALFSGLENGVLRPVIGRELPLVQAPKAHEDILKSSAYGKIVLIP